MSDRQETTDDILKEMRSHPIQSVFAYHDMNLADRLEAALKRERGNAAAMREALEKIVSLTNSLDENCSVDPVEIRDIARDALASEFDRIKDFDE